MGRSFGSQLEAGTIAARFVAAFTKQEAIDRTRGWATQEEREIARWRAIVREVLNDVPDSEACFETLYQHFSQPDAWRCDPDTEETLSRLSSQGYVLGMASNFDSRLKSIVAGLKPLQPLHHVVISSLVGWRKPALPFFQRLGTVVGISLEQILYIGDDYDNDYVGASQAGLHVVLLDPRGQQPIPGTQRLRRLRDLLG